jgi:hypothetical protein
MTVITASLMNPLNLSLALPFCRNQAIPQDIPGHKAAGPVRV